VDQVWFCWMMKFLFASISSILLSSSIYSASEWLYYKEYPWVYDAKTEDWLYLQGGADKKIYAYRASTKVWEEFSVNYVINWDKQYSEWLKNPDAFGGKEVLEQIKNAKDSNSTTLGINYSVGNFDISPVGGLTNLKILRIHTSGTSSELTDISPISGLVNLEELYITDHKKLSDITPLQNLKKLKKLYLDGNNISDVSPLGGLINLSEKLLLYSNNISDVSPLTGLVNLKVAEFHYNNISLEQRNLLIKALPNAELYW